MSVLRLARNTAVAVLLMTLCPPIISACGMAPQQNSPVRSMNPEDIFGMLRMEFQQRNRSIAKASVIEMRGAGRNKYLVLAHAVTNGTAFNGNFDDELFGLFLIDTAAGRVERVLEMMPTPRWYDYTMWIEKASAYQVTIAGKGATYGDQRFHKTYMVGTTSIASAQVEAAKRLTTLMPSSFPRLPASIQRRLDLTGCRIPQDSANKKPHNVVSGPFAAPNQLDWAVLCSIDGAPSIHVFWGGYESCADPVVEWIVPDWYFVTEAGRWTMVLRTIPASEIARAMPPEAKPPAHDGLLNWYCSEGVWGDRAPIP